MSSISLSGSLTDEVFVALERTCKRLQDNLQIRSVCQCRTSTKAIDQNTYLTVVFKIVQLLVTSRFLQQCVLS